MDAKQTILDLVTHASVLIDEALLIEHIYEEEKAICHALGWFAAANFLLNVHGELWYLIEHPHFVKLRKYQRGRTFSRIKKI